MQSKKRVTRTNWVKLKTDDLVIKLMNQRALEESKGKSPDPILTDEVIPKEESKSSVKNEINEEENMTHLDSHDEKPTPEFEDHEHDQSSVDDPHEHPQDDQQSNTGVQSNSEHQEEKKDPSEDDADEEWEVVQPSVARDRGRRNPNRPTRFVHHTALQAGLKKHG